MSGHLDGKVTSDPAWLGCLDFFKKSFNIAIKSFKFEFCFVCEKDLYKYQVLKLDA